MIITIKTPIKAYLDSYTDSDIFKLREQLSYVNGKTDQLLKRHKNNRWFKQKNPVGWEERLEQLQSELNASVLMKDSNGYFIRPASIPYLKDVEFDIKNLVKPNKLNPLPWKVEPEFTPYPYQSDSVEELLKLEGIPGNIEIATGMGKSLILLLLAQKIGESVVVVTPSKSIFRELYSEFQLRLGKDKVGGYGDGKKDIKKPITIAIGKSITMLKEGTEEYEFFKNKKNLMVDECFPYRTKIKTEIGPINIGRLYSIFKEGGELPKILSFNEKTGKYEYKKMLNAWKTPNKPTLKISYGSVGGFRCTDRHRILTNNGWKESKDLKIGDYIVSKKDKGGERSEAARVPNDDMMDLIVGSFLGDGHISYSSSGIPRLRVIHSTKQRIYSRWKNRMFGDIRGDIGYIKKNGYAEKPAISFTTKNFFLEEKLPSNKKTCPDWIIDKINLKSLAIWFMDDGSSDIRNGYLVNATLHTQSFSEKTIDKLVAKITEIGFPCKKLYSKGFYIRFNIKSAHKLLKQISPFIHKSMSYKANNIKSTGTGRWDCQLKDYSYVKISNIERFEKIYNKSYLNNLYDIEVEDNHNFLVGRGSVSIVAHNCHTWGADTLEKTCHEVLGGCSRRLFVSATQTRGDGTLKLLHSIIGKSMIKKDIKEGIDGGFLCPLKFNVVPVISPDTRYKKDPLECKRVHFLYNDEITKFSARLANAQWKVNQESTLILVEELVQIQKLVKLLDVPYTYIHSSSKKEAAVYGLEKVDLTEQLERFNTGEVKVLIGTKSIATGTNIYPTHHTINFTGGSSEINVKQGPMGRSTRWIKPKYKHLHKDKKFSQIWDFDVIGQPILERMLKTRIKYYRETGEEVMRLKI